MNHPGDRVRTGTDDARDREFDLIARSHHARSLVQLSPHVRARLREARHTAVAPAPAAHRFGWLVAGGAIVATLALMLALQLRPTTSQPELRMADATPVLDPAERARRRAEIDGELDDMLVALDENPDLYLWLASNDDALPPPSKY